MNTPVVLDSDSRARLVNSTTGIQLVKGGQTGNEGFFAAVINSYTNLVNNVPVLITGAFMIFMFLAETGAGPLEAINGLLTDIAYTAEYDWEKTLALSAVKLVSFIIRYKNVILKMAFAWLPYFAKPSTNSMYLSLIHTIMVFLLRHWSVLIFIFVAQAHFLFVSMRNPLHKMIIVAITLLLLFVEIEIGGKIINPIKTATTPPPPTPKPDKIFKTK